jgi:large subunit ribosomal protein L4
VDVLYVDQLNAYDVLLSDDVVFTQTALDAFIAAKSGTQGGAATEEVSA